MKPFILIALFCLCFSSYGQHPKKSDSIFNDIKELSLKNNKLIVESFLSNHTDSIYKFSIHSLGVDRIKKIIQSDKGLFTLDDTLALIDSKLDSIRNTNAKYKALRLNYDTSNYSNQLRIHPEFAKINKELTTQNQEFGRLYHQMELLRTQRDRLTIIRLLEQSQKKGEILSTNFIPRTDLIQINETMEIRKNNLIINTLYKRYNEVLQEEVTKKY